MNALARTSYRIYNSLNGYLYRRDVTRQGSSLQWGVLNENEGTIKHATAAGHYLDPLPLCYRKALEVAILEGDEKMVKLLLEVDIDMNSVMPWSYNPPPLLMAIEEYQIAIVGLLLASPNVDPNIKTPETDEPALLVACKKGYDDMVEQFLTRDDVDVNAQDKQHVSPLHCACNMDYVGIARRLLARDDIDINAFGFPEGSTPLAIASLSQEPDIVNLLLAKDGIKVNLQDDNGETPLFAAARARSVRVMESLLARDDLDPNVHEFNLGRTALMEVCQREEGLDLVKLLLDKEGIDLNKQDNSGYTALSLAVESDNFEAAKLLLARPDINPNLRNDQGQTALSIAYRQNSPSMVNLLLGSDDPTPSRGARTRRKKGALVH